MKKIILYLMVNLIFSMRKFMIKEKLSSLKEKYIFDEPDYRVIKRINRKKNELFYT